MTGVWAFAEKREHMIELLNPARSLADQIGTRLVALLPREPELANEYIQFGADEVFMLPAVSAGQSADTYAPLITGEASGRDPDVILFAQTRTGRELATRIAARLDTGLCSACTAMTFDKETKTLHMQRLAYGGAVVQRIGFNCRPAMATVPAGVFESASVTVARKGTIRNLSGVKRSSLKVLEKRAIAQQVHDISEARVVVCVGRGFDKKEDLRLAEELAQILGGEIGCTRPVSKENHWLPEDLCIGLSGVQVKPELYIGLGVSGQVQHVIGIRNAKIICAVNNDENAPIFRVADLSIVGDLYQAVPRLIQQLKQ